MREGRKSKANIVRRPDAWTFTSPLPMDIDIVDHEVLDPRTLRGKPPLFGRTGAAQAL
jgi:hypothetical protein